MPGDWQFWRQYLTDNRTLCVVAIEFQTGNRNRAQGCKALDNLARIQHEIGQSLHPVIIGGGQFIEYVADRFDKFTLMDSEPFMKAVKRRAFEPKNGYRSCVRVSAWRGSPSMTCWRQISKAIASGLNRNSVPVDPTNRRLHRERRRRQRWW